MEKHCSEDIIMVKHCSEDIVLEILTRLPAKSLMRFKCISKAWNTLIGHPNFAKLHKARSQARLLFELEVEPRFWKFRPHYKKYPTRKRRRLEGCSLELTGPYHCFNYDEMSICSNHCNGLVCLYSFKDTQAYLYNVATGEIMALPFSVNPQKYPEFFLGFDMVTEKYKLLHVFVKRNNGILRIKSRILTLGINSWRKIIMPLNFFWVRPEGCIFLDGVLYPINKPVTYFNFREEEFGNLPHIQHSIFSLNIMQTALSGKLVIHCGRRSEDLNMLYDDLNKVFTTFVNNSNYPSSEKVALLETERIDMTKSGNAVLATASIIGAPNSLVFPDPFILRSVSSFVENIIPLASLF